MGNWNITINGVGCHHNQNNPTDANLMTQKFVSDLRAAGHSVGEATFTYGGAEKYIPNNDEMPTPIYEAGQLMAQ
jgi:hypothetical protein